MRRTVFTFILVILSFSCLFVLPPLFRAVWHDYEGTVVYYGDLEFESTAVFTDVDPSIHDYVVVVRFESDDPKFENKTLSFGLSAGQYERAIIKHPCGSNVRQTIFGFTRYELSDGIVEKSFAREFRGIKQRLFCKPFWPSVSD